MHEEVTVAGAGLAGCEAAYQLAKRGIRVRLLDIKPKSMSPAHSSRGFAELVCSNSLKAKNIESASGLLKAEMKLLGSLFISAAESCALPAGGALAVDRERFSGYITEYCVNQPLIDIVCEEFTVIPEEGNYIIATGPLTSNLLSENLAEKLGTLHFYDASAPIVTRESIDMGKAYFGSRYGKGDADYINCPMDESQYNIFWNELINAETVELKDFENKDIFEGCMPVEIMAGRGRQTLVFGPLKPVGLEDSDGKRPFAVVQLRQEDEEKRLYGLVGFQTNLRFAEQQRVFSMIPGLENAEFVRYGVMHRNTYISAPGLLDATYRLKDGGNVFFAGQLTGVEGYVESAASGMVAGISMARRLLGRKEIIFPKETMIGALANYVSAYSGKDYQPMNANFGIVPPLPEKVRGGKKARNTVLGNRSLDSIRGIIENEDLL